VAELLGVKETWLRDNQSWLPCTKVGKRLTRYSRTDIETIVRAVQE
jgi:hypothetical protein